MRDYRTGDVLAFGGASGISTWIKIATLSRISHVGVIGWTPTCVLREQQRNNSRITVDVDKWESQHLLYESTTLNTVPCVLTGKTIEGVQAHTPDDVIDRYDGKVWLYRVNLEESFTQEQVTNFTSYLLRLIGNQYDLESGVISVTRILKRWLYEPQNLHYAFCSEVAAGAFRYVGKYPYQNVSKINPKVFVDTLVELGVITLREQLK